MMRTHVGRLASGGLVSGNFGRVGERAHETIIPLRLIASHNAPIPQDCALLPSEIVTTISTHMDDSARKVVYIFTYQDGSTHETRCPVEAEQISRAAYGR